MPEYKTLAESFEQVETAIKRSLNLVQTTGSAEDKIMSQKAVTDSLSNFHEKYIVLVGTSWTLLGGVYTQTVTATGIKGANDYICSIITSSDQTIAKAEEEAFCQVNSITISDDSLTLTAFPPMPITPFYLLILR
jgi:hypothetical protein